MATYMSHKEIGPGGAGRVVKVYGNAKSAVTSFIYFLMFTFEGDRDRV